MTTRFFHVVFTYDEKKSKVKSPVTLPGDCAVSSLKFHRVVAEYSFTCLPCLY